MATELANIGLLASMLPKMVSEVAWFPEYFVAVLVQTLEDVVFPLGLLILHLDHPVPVVGYALKVLPRDNVMHEAFVLHHTLLVIKPKSEVLVGYKLICLIYLLLIWVGVLLLRSFYLRALAFIFILNRGLAALHFQLKFWFELKHLLEEILEVWCFDRTSIILM